MPSNATSKHRQSPQARHRKALLSPDAPSADRLPLLHPSPDLWHVAPLQPPQLPVAAQASAISADTIQAKGVSTGAADRQLATPLSTMAACGLTRPRFGQPEPSAVQLTTPSPAPASFPTGLVPPRPLGHAITSIAMPSIAMPATPAIPAATQMATPKATAPKKQTKRKPAPKPTPLRDIPVIALPDRSEPLVTPAPAFETQAQPGASQSRALIKPTPSLGTAIGNWLRSVGGLLSLGLLPPGAGARASQQGGWLMLRRRQKMTPEMRKADEMAQLRAENRWLRMKLHAIEARREAERNKETHTQRTYFEKS